MGALFTRRNVLRASVSSGLLTVGAGVGLNSVPAAQAAPPPPNLPPGVQPSPTVAGGAMTTAGQYMLDTFKGGTDDDKLVTAASYLGAQTYQQPLILSGREYNFTRPFVYSSGLKIIGSGCGWQNPERSAGRLTTQRVNVNVGTDTNAWLVGSGTVFDVTLSNLSFVSTNGKSQLLHHPYPGTLYCCAFDNLALTGFKHGFGSSANNCSITASGFGGRWSILNGSDTQLSLGGSDSDLFIAGQCNFGPADKAASGNGRYLMHIDSLGKSNIGPMYFTADSGYRALQIVGSTAYTDVTLNGLRFEGRNASDPSQGALVTVKGGNVRMNDSWVAYGMANPAAYPGTPDLGIIQVLGGDVIIDGMRYDRAAGVSQDVPLIYAAAGAQVEVARVRRVTRSGGWTALPVLKAVAGAVVNADSSVRVLS